MILIIVILWILTKIFNIWLLNNSNKTNDQPRCIMFNFVKKKSLSFPSITITFMTRLKKKKVTIPTLLVIFWFLPWSFQPMLKSTFYFPPPHRTLASTCSSPKEKRKNVIIIVIQKRKARNFQPCSARCTGVYYIT